MKKLLLLTLLTTSLVAAGTERIDGGTCDSCKKDELIRQYESELLIHRMLYWTVFTATASAWLTLCFVDDQVGLVRPIIPARRGSVADAV